MGELKIVGGGEKGRRPKRYGGDFANYMCGGLKLRDAWCC